MKRERIHPVVENIRKIMTDRNLKQSVIAEFADTSVSQMSKIFNGEVQLSLWQLSNIASNLNMSIEDIVVYPDIINIDKSSHDKVKASLTIELDQDKKDQVMKLVFGKNSLEIFNK